MTGRIIILNVPARTAAQMRGLKSSAAAKGRRTINGRPYNLVGSSTKREVEKSAELRRKIGQSCRIFKSKHYGDWELWASRVDRRK